MPSLEIRATSKWWYGRWVANGKTYVRNLRVEIDGKRPASINGNGDRRFEASRAIANAELARIANDAQSRKRAETLVQTLHEIKTGRQIESIPLARIYDEWTQAPRRSSPTPKHAQWVKRVLARFADYAAAHHPQVEEIGQVTHAVASGFMATELGRRTSGRTYNTVRSTLRSVFKSLRRKAGLTENPFDDIVPRQENTRHRIPFKPAELKKILDAGRSDAFCYPLILTGICTALRLGDVCRLKWTDVDLENGCIGSTTSKTGARVYIPIFPMLSDLLSDLPRTSEYCFPEAAAMYNRNPKTINYRLNKVFTAAGGSGSDGATEARGTGTPLLAEVPESEKRDRGMKALDALTDTDYSAKVRQAMRSVLDLYLRGGTVNTIARDLHMAKSSAFLHLKRIEQAVGFAVLRKSRSAQPAPRLAEAHGKDTKCAGAARKVNQRGFHAFRATWVTLALTRNVPIEVVRRVTGHTTTQTVLDHYFQPGGDDFRAALQNAMPALLTQGAQSKADQARAILSGMTAETWSQDRDRLLALLAPTPSQAVKP